MKTDQEQRDRIIRYKKIFGSQDGKQILMDLMNRFHVLNAHKGDPFSEGQRSVVLHMMAQTNMNMEAFDKLLRGEL